MFTNAHDWGLGLTLFSAIIVLLGIQSLIRNLIA